MLALMSLYVAVLCGFRVYKMWAPLPRPFDFSKLEIVSAWGKFGAWAIAALFAIAMFFASL